MSPTQWGPPTWIFLHTIAEKVKESSFETMRKSIIHNIIQICHFLPCPECAQHAKEFWQKVNFATIKTKTDLKNVLFVFHNSVNRRRKQALFKYENLEYYKRRNVVETYNKFAANFNTYGNMNLITDSFHRVRLLAQVKKWITVNIYHFDV
jgi:hypothetical protein